MGCLITARDGVAPGMPSEHSAGERRSPTGNCIAISAQKQTWQLGKSWFGTRAHQPCPCDERHTGEPLLVFQQHERFVVHGIPLRGRSEKSAMTLIIAVAWCDMMFHGNFGIEHQRPTGATERQTQCELPKHLSTGAHQSRIESDGTQERRPVRSVRTFQDIHRTRRTGAEMVIADHPSEPLDPSDVCAVGSLLCLPVATADATYPRIIKSIGNALDPICVRLGIVVREGNNVAATLAEGSVHCSDHPGLGSDGTTDRKWPRRSECVEAICGLGIMGPKSHHDFKWCLRLTPERVQTTLQSIWPAPGRHEYGDRRQRQGD